MSNLEYYIYYFPHIIFLKNKKYLKLYDIVYNKKLNDRGISIILLRLAK